MKKNNYLQTRTGICFDLDDPDPVNVTLPDIIWALAHLPRFTGHAGGYSVAQHSVTCAREAAHRGMDLLTIRCALMHDAHEAYTGDVSTPVKKCLGDSWRDFERSIQYAVRERFGLPYEDPEAVKLLDAQACLSEASFFLGTLKGDGWPPESLGGLRLFGHRIWGPQEAMEEMSRFCDRYEVI